MAALSLEARGGVRDGGSGGAEEELSQSSRSERRRPAPKASALRRVSALPARAGTSLWFTTFLH